MVEATATIRNSAGIHCRPSAAIVKAINDYPGRMEISAPGGTCDPRSIMGLLSLCLEAGTPVRITVDGPDETATGLQAGGLAGNALRFPHPPHRRRHHDPAGRRQPACPARDHAVSPDPFGANPPLPIRPAPGYGSPSMHRLVCLALLLPLSVLAQGSDHALRFFGTGSGQQDRAKFRVDAPANALDVGNDFTIEFWLRANYADNAGTVSAVANGDGWIEGNVVVDRDVYGEGDNGDFGLALGRAGPHLRLAFGADAATGLTIVGTNHVGDGVWHHIAATRVRSSGLMRLYVDGRLDAQGNGPTGDLSYRDGRATSWPQSDPFLVLAAEKHDAGAAYPSFNGYLDEFRVWTQALTQAQISNVFRSVLATNTSGLIACYRFEEGSGTNLADSTGRSPTGLLIAGTAGNGQWVARASDTNNTAPVQPPGPTLQLHLATRPAGLLLAVNSVTQATPFRSPSPPAAWSSSKRPRTRSPWARSTFSAAGRTAARAAIPSRSAPRRSRAAPVMPPPPAAPSHPPSRRPTDRPSPTAATLPSRMSTTVTPCAVDGTAAAVSNWPWPFRWRCLPA
jgi:phosphotransferase system HPr (HPr) family protein